MSAADREEAEPSADLQRVVAYADSARALRQTDFHRARLEAQQALDLLHTLQTPAARFVEREAELRVLLGSIDRQAGNVEATVVQCHAALKLVGGAATSAATCDAWINLGSAYTHLGAFPYALRYSLQGLKTARALGLRDREAYALDVLGTLYAIFGDSDEGLRHLEAGVAIAREIGQRMRLCSLLNNLAMTRLGREEYAAALRAGREAASIARADGFKLVEVNVLDTIASVLVAQGDLGEAESCLVPAVAEARKSGSGKVLADLLGNLGTIRAASGDLAQAESLFREALINASRIGNPVLELRCHKRLADLLAAASRWQEAHEAFRRYHDLYDAVAGAKAAKRLTVVRIADELDALPGAVEPAAARNESTVGALETLTARLQARNRELEETKRAAEAASEAKSRFLSNMSHELRTPLNGVLGMAGLLQRTPLDGTQARYCRAIVQSAQALDDLVTDLLDYTALDAGGLVLQPVEFDPAPLLDEVADLVRPAASARGLHVACERGADLPRSVHGDAKRIRQVLLHLARNAVKFTRQGGVDFSLSRLPSPAGDPRSWLRFAVRDTGIGIDPKAAAALFKPFVQGDDSLSRRHGGSGLGLVIGKRLVDLMGGSLAFHSEPAQGSTFWFDVPLLEGSTAAPGGG